MFSNHCHFEQDFLGKIVSTVIIILCISQQCHTLHDEKYWLRVLGDKNTDNLRVGYARSQSGLPPELDYMGQGQRHMFPRSFQHLYNYKQTTNPWDKIYKHRMALWHNQMDSHVPSMSNDLFMKQIYDGECETDVCREFNSDGGGFSMAKFSKFSCKCPEGKTCKTSFKSGLMQGLCVTDPSNSSNPDEDGNREQLFGHTVFFE